MIGPITFFHTRAIARSRLCSCATPYDGRVTSTALCFCPVHGCASQITSRISRRTEWIVPQGRGAAEVHRGSVCGVGWSSDQRWLASGEWDNAIRLWDAGSGACLHVIQLRVTRSFRRAFVSFRPAPRDARIIIVERVEHAYSYEQSI
jgi:WD40 repeat protein